jgi:predicted nucleic acid-binding protein
VLISFDTNILVYATASVPDAKALRARDLIGGAMRAGWTILLLQTLAEFTNLAIRKAGIPIEDIRRTIDAWRAVLPIQAADGDDLALTDCRSGTRCSGLRRNVPACGVCLLKICKMGSSYRVSDSSTRSNERMID